MKNKTKIDDYITTLWQLKEIAGAMGHLDQYAALEWALHLGEERKKSEETNGTDD